MIAGKQMDMVMGVDIHIVSVPTPGGPIPTPLPHPFIGMVLDPMEYIPFIGCAVWVNGLPGAYAGAEGKAIPPHFPMPPGVSFIKPVDSECEIFMGSATVLLEGEPMSSLGMMVLSCSCIGMPSPPRPTKKPEAGLKLPTSTLLAIPGGQLVLVGGPPTVSLMAVGMKAFGMGFKMLKNTKGFKKFTDKIKDLAKKGKNKAKGMFSRLKCMITGHPVIIATGEVFTDAVDFELPGPIPFIWERIWYSSENEEYALGHGWNHKYDLRLYHDEINDCMAFVMEDGRINYFPILEDEEEAYNRQEKMLFKREDNFYIIRDENRLFYRFKAPVIGRPKVERLLSIEDQTGHRIEFKYNLLGRLEQIIDSAGRKLQIENDSKGRITAIYAPHPGKKGETFRIVTYKYDALGNLIECLDAYNKVFRYEYDHHLLIKETDRNGLNFRFAYDGKDEFARCIRTWGDDGIYDHKLTYNTEEQYTIVENSLGHKTTHYWNDDGQVYKSVDPLRQERITKFGTFGQVVQEIDELGQATYYQYDEFGYQTGIEYADGTAINMEYQDGLLVAATDQNGGSYAWTYNEQAQLILRSNPIGNTSSYKYEDGDLVQIIDPASSITNLSYDEDKNLNSLTTPDGESSHWKYDALGRNILSTDPNGNQQKRKFDLLGRVLRINEPDGNTRYLEYDAEGNVTKAKDQQHDVRFEYVGMGRLKTRIEAGTKVAFEYDTEENLKGIINEHGHAYHFELDERDDVVTESGFDGVTRRYQRDAAGKVVGVERASGIRTNYDYDLLGRVTKVLHSDGSSERYAYRADGELVAADNDHIKVAFERDALGRVIAEKQGGFVIKSEYDVLGMRTHLESSLGAKFQFQRNSMGDVEQVAVNGAGKDWEAQFERDNLGLEVERMLPGGVKSKWKRDRLGRPIQQETTAGGKRTRSRKYVWGANDRLKQIIDEQKGTFQFEHDVFGNLAGATYPDGSQELRMPDAVGNLFKTREQKDRKYGKAGQLLEANGTRYEYDKEGNLIRKIKADGAIWQYQWNAAGMLRAVLRPDGHSVSFTYDALGRRIAKKYRKKTTRWVWDGNVPLHEWKEDHKSPPPSTPKTNPTSGSSIKIKPRIKITPRHEKITIGKQDTQSDTAILVQANEKEESLTSYISNLKSVTTWVFEPESFAPLAKLQDEHQYSIITDHLGTPVGMYNDEGTKVWDMDLSIYGEVRAMNGWRDACPFRYPGQYEDEETGLYYNRFRYYDAEGGFYVSQDPIGLAGGILNIYAYAWDVNNVSDPAGLSGVPSYSILKDLVQNSLDFSTAKDGAVFWSGPRMIDAQNWAAANGKTTLEQTKGGKYLDSLDLFNKKSGLTGNQAAEIWDIASKKFADGASGNVNVFSTGAKKFGPYGKRTWWRIELPALLKNTRISNIFRRNKSGGKTKKGHISCKR